MTEHLQRNPTYEKGKGRPLPAQGAQLANLTTIKLSRKKSPETSGRTCVESMLCKVHPELYIPSLDPTHKECTWPVPFQEVGYAVLIGSWVVKYGVLWSGGVIWSGSLDCRWWCDLMIWFGGRVVTTVFCGIRMWWSDLGSDLIVWCGGLMDCFHGLIWRCAWGRWSGLTAENWKTRSWVNSSKTWLNSVSDS